MSFREKFKEWIGGNYNVRQPFNDILEWLLFGDEVAPIIHSHVIEEIDGLRDELEEIAGANHTHPIAHIVDLQDELDSRSLVGHGHNYADLSGKPTLFSGSWDDLTDKPSLFPALLHPHDIDDIADLQDELDGKADLIHSHEWGDITGKPSSFTPSLHGHVISDITNLQAQLDDKIAKNPKAAARTNVTTGTSGLALTVLGLSVVSAAALTRLDEYGTAINDILSRLRSREIIAT